MPLSYKGKEYYEESLSTYTYPQLPPGHGNLKSSTLDTHKQLLIIHTAGVYNTTV